MTIQELNHDGMHVAAQELTAGRAVILPCSSPLPYAVAGTSAPTVNTAKGRPADQPVGMAIADATKLTRHIALDPDSWHFAEWASRARHVNILVPMTDAAPDWAHPAISAG